MPRKILEQIIKQTSSHLMIKGTSAKWARTNLFPFPASHQSHRKERGHKGHVSWLSSTFDSVSDVIFIVSKLKREIYERVTQSLSENHSKSVSGSRRGGEMYQEQQGRLVPGLAPLSIVAGAAEGSREATLVCTPTPWGEMGINRGCNSEQGQVRMRRCCQAGTTDKSSWAIARLADGWAGSRRATPGSAVFLRQANATLGCTNKDTACKARAGALFLYPAGAEVQLEVRLPEKECARSDTVRGQPWGWQGAWRSSPMRTDYMHRSCSAWRRKEEYFNVWGYKAEGNSSTVYLWGSKEVSG